MKKVRDEGERNKKGGRSFPSTAGSCIHRLCLGLMIYRPGKADMTHSNEHSVPVQVHSH